MTALKKKSNNNFLSSIKKMNYKYKNLLQIKKKSSTNYIIIISINL